MPSAFVAQSLGTARQVSGLWAMYGVLEVNNAKSAGGPAVLLVESYFPANPVMGFKFRFDSSRMRNDQPMVA